MVINFYHLFVVHIAKTCLHRYKTLQVECVFIKLKLFTNLKQILNQVNFCYFIGEMTPCLYFYSSFAVKWFIMECL